MTFAAIRGRATTTPLATISFAIAAIAAATLAGAWFFELVLGYRPCPLGLLLVYDSAFGVYHAGIEWGLWKGPVSCTGTLRPPGDILSSLQNSQFVPCDRAAWTFLGISLAGYNALIAGALAVLALVGARRTA